MVWSWDAIEREWLAGGRVAATPQEIITAFTITERLLGQAWLDSKRIQSGVHVTGAQPVAVVVAMGRRLERLQHASGLDAVLRRIQTGDHAAVAELTAA